MCPGWRSGCTPCTPPCPSATASSSPSVRGSASGKARSSPSPPEAVDFLRRTVWVRRQVNCFAGTRLVLAPPRAVGPARYPRLERGRRAHSPLQRCPAPRDAPPSDAREWRARDRDAVATTRERRAHHRKYFNPASGSLRRARVGIEDPRDNGRHALRHKYASVMLEPASPSAPSPSTSVTSTPASPFPPTPASCPPVPSEPVRLSTDTPSLSARDLQRRARHDQLPASDHRCNTCVLSPTVRYCTYTGYQTRSPAKTGTIHGRLWYPDYEPAAAPGSASVPAPLGMRPRGRLGALPQLVPTGLPGRRLAPCRRPTHRVDPRRARCAPRPGCVTPPPSGAASVRPCDGEERPPSCGVEPVLSGAGADEPPARRGRSR